MIVKMTAPPVLRLLRTKATMARMIARNVENTAASCGDLPKGAAVKNDQLARERPSRRWTTRMRPTFVPENTR